MGIYFCIIKRSAMRQIEIADKNIMFSMYRGYAVVINKFYKRFLSPSLSP